MADIGLIIYLIYLLSLISVISCDRKQDRNEELNTTMIKMAESRFRPKPRPRQKSADELIVSSNGSGEKLNSKFPLSPPSKRPVVKPKPKGYKSCEFNSQGLVSITKDIDIGDVSVTSTASENAEKNNNISNVKDACVLGNVSGNSTRNAIEKPENISRLSKSYDKPLPPIPNEDSEHTMVEKQNRNVAPSDSNVKASNNFESLCTPPLPTKTHRMRPFASETQLQGQNRKPGALFDKHSVSLTNLTGNSDSSPASGYPTLPQKPMILRHPSEQSLDALGPFSLPSQSGFKTNVTQPEDVLMQRAGDRWSVPIMAGFNTENSLAPSNVKNSPDNDIGRTPPLPRKPFLQRGNQDGKRPTSVGLLLGNQTRQTPPTQTVVKNKTSSTSEDRRDHPNIRPDHIPEGHGSAANERQGHPGLSPPSTRPGPPQKALPRLPPDSKKAHSAARRPPPGLPKQPSFERKNGPPPLPEAPRPKSIFPDEMIKLRSMSEGDLVGNEASLILIIFIHCMDCIHIVFQPNVLSHGVVYCFQPSVMSHNIVYCL